MVVDRDVKATGGRYGGQFSSARLQEISDELVLLLCLWYKS